MIRKYRLSAIMSIFIVLVITIYTQQSSTGSESLGNSKTQSISPVLILNNLTTQLATENKLTPTELARAYALVHVAVYDSLLSGEKYDPKNISELDIIISSASEVLSYLFPNNSKIIPEIKKALGQSIAGYDKSSTSIGSKLGQVTGKYIVEYAKNDGSNLIFTNPIPPTDQCIWNGSTPVTPMAGHWKTYILASASEVRPPPPATCQSEEDLKNIQEVIDASNNRTSYQITAVHYWGDKLPPVVWNSILNEEIEKRKLPLFDAARASAYLNMAMYDACMSTWFTKYTYWTARPVQRISNFSTVIPTPNFPSYTSGHATMSAAASEVLSELFPDQSENFYNKANQAKMSRLWAGIHFPQDNERGADVGKQIGKIVVKDMRSPPHTFVYLGN